MKNLILLFAVLVVTSVSMVSCEEDDPTGPAEAELNEIFLYGADMWHPMTRPFVLYEKIEEFYDGEIFSSIDDAQTRTKKEVRRIRDAILLPTYQTYKIKAYWNGKEFYVISEATTE